MPYTPDDRRAIARSLFSDWDGGRLDEARMEKVAQALEILIDSGCTPGQPQMLIEHYAGLGEGWRRRFWEARIRVRNGRVANTPGHLLRSAA